MIFNSKIIKDLFRIYSNHTKLSKMNSFQLSYTILKYSIISSSFRVIFFYRIIRYLYLKESFLINILKIINLINPIQIPYTAVIDEGLSLPHANCIIIHKHSIIGKNATILQGVTIGGNVGKRKEINGKMRYSPIIGDNVLLGAGAKILGPITIGDNCIIGANAVVTKDIPSNSVAVGIPANVIKEVKKNFIEIEQSYLN